MLTDRLLIDLDSRGPFFVSPLDDEALENLRWYLEDYLRAPFGVYEERGPRVQASLPRWGEALFSALFGEGPAKDAYARARASGRPVELMLQSASARLLGLPWELATDPAQPVPLALDLAGMSRHLPGTDPAAGPAEPVAVAGRRLRVLLVVARPSGPADVGYRMVARALVERLPAVREEADLVLLRPPTLSALAETLAQARQAGDPFHVVHFDGHGMSPRPVDGLVPHGPGEAVLVFETSGGGANPVPASRIARILNENEVPLVVLNACQSGAIGRDLEAAVATRLLSTGTASVVAMAYTVYAVAAAEFMAAFYERIFAGESVSAAVRAGRSRMFHADRRPSPKGPMPLADWLVPVHYMRRDIYFPQLATAAGAAGGTSAGTAAGRSDRTDLAPAGPFVGRDDLFRRMEIAARQYPVIVLHGLAGSGKTELAKAFGRWWQDTGGVERPDWVLWHSFEPSAADLGLDSALTGIGSALLGPDFPRQAPSEFRRVTVAAAMVKRALVTWDNFETLRSMPDPVNPASRLDDAACSEIRSFLGSLEAGGSVLLITSRSPEEWLGDVCRIQVDGLAPEEAAEYADVVLRAHPAGQSRRAERDFGELMQWLDGNPRTIRLTLPHLETNSAADLLALLRGTVAAPVDARDPSGRHELYTSLVESLHYSYIHLGYRTAQLLPALCLFEGVASVSMLGAFSHTDGVPEPFAGVDPAEWYHVLAQTAGTGLLAEAGMNAFRIHPALPSLLSGLWRLDRPGTYAAHRETATSAMAFAYGALGLWLTGMIESGRASQAYTFLAHEYRTMSAMLGYCLDQERWNEAESIRRALEIYLMTRGMHSEADRWTDRVRHATEGPDGSVPPVDSARGGLWVAAVSDHANRRLQGGDFDAAEATYRSILEKLSAQPSTPQTDKQIAGFYHNLGVLVQGRGKIDEAAGLLSKSLALMEATGDHANMAKTYFQLGRGAQLCGRVDEAAKWMRKYEEAVDSSGMA